MLVVSSDVEINIVTCEAVCFESQCGEGSACDSVTVRRAAFADRYAVLYGDATVW